MTFPNSIFNPTPDPIENKANWLGRYLAVEKGFSEKLSRVLTDAAANIDDFFGDLKKDNVSTKVARVRIGLAHKEIRKQFRDIFGTTRNLIVDHQQDAAVAAVNAKLYDEKGVLSWLFPDPVNRVQYADSLRQTAKRNIEATMTRALFTEKPLSERVYKTEALANGIVSRTINNALARGDSAVNLAKDVRALIDPAVPGGVSYAAMRLGRTEINNAFHAQSIIDSQDTPWVQSMRWNLSKRHEKDPGDECETYAATGSFAKERVPEKPHPNCRCFVTPDLPDYEDFENSLVSGYYDSYLDSVMGQGFSQEQQGPVSGAFAAKKKSSAAPVKWTGPKVGEPLRTSVPSGTRITEKLNQELMDNRAITQHIEYAWQSTNFDRYKKYLRIGGRDAQRVGYVKFPTSLRESVTEELANGRGDYLLDSDPGLLNTYGREIVARAVNSEPTTKPIFRGMIIERSELEQASNPGTPIAMPLSSFDTNQDFAIDFAQGRAWQSEDVKKLKEPAPVIIQLESGARVAPVGGSERVAFGQFEVIDVLPPKDVKIERLSQQVVTERPTVLVVRQKSMIEPEATSVYGRMASEKTIEEIDREIKEFQIIDDPLTMEGVAPNAKTRKALTALKEALPKTRIVTADASLDPTVLSEMATSYKELYKKYPEVLDEYRSLGFGDPGTTTLAETTCVNDINDIPKAFKDVTGRGSTVLFSTKNFATKPKITELITKTVGKSQLPGVEEDPIKSIVYHEFGHQLAIALGQGNPKSAIRSLNQFMFETYDRTHPNQEDKTGPKLHAWLDQLAQELPSYASITDNSPRTWEEVDLNEALPVSFEAAELRPDRVIEIQRLMHKFMIDNYDLFIKKKKARRSRKK